MSARPRALQRSIFCFVFALLGSNAGAATETAEPHTYAVERFDVEYRDPHPDHPPLDALLPLPVHLGLSDLGYAAPSDPAAGVDRKTLEIGGPVGWDSPQIFKDSGIAAVDQTLLEVLQDAGLIGVYVAPHPEDIDVATGEDLRGDRTALRLQIFTGRVKALRTVAGGSRIAPEWRVNNEVHRRIRKHSPIQPSGQGSEGTTDLLSKNVLEDFLFRLNRHPGRYVEAALASTPEGDGVAIDYLVNETRPWFAYAQVSDTGTDATNDWQQRYGFIHRQVTDRDDILSIEYGNTGFDDVHTVRVAYEAPWFDRARATWAYDKATDPSWFRREWFPWAGVNGLRWNGNFGYDRFEADAVDRTDDYVGEEFSGGAGITFNLWQHRGLFVDFVGGFQVRDIRVNNATITGETDPNGLGSGKQLFFLPRAGFDIERISEVSSLRGSLLYEANVASTDTDDLELLGRRDIDGKFQIVHFNLGASHYLEPLLFPKAWKDPSTLRSSTLAHELSLGVRGQYGFSYRLMPQATQSIGGLYSVRGYPQSEATGDSVYLASIEYRFHLPRSLPVRREPLNLPVFGNFRIAPQQAYGRTDWDLVLSVYADAGRTVRNHRDRANFTTDPTGVQREVNQTLVGWGAGAELRIRQNFTARLNWGRSLKTTKPTAGSDATPKGNDEVHLLFSVLY